MLSHLMLLQGLQRQKHRVIIPHIVSPDFDVLFRTGGRGSTVIYQRLGTQSVQESCRLVVVAAKEAKNGLFLIVFDLILSIFDDLV